MACPGSIVVETRNEPSLHGMPLPRRFRLSLATHPAGDIKLGRCPRFGGGAPFVSSGRPASGIEQIVLDAEDLAVFDVHEQRVITVAHPDETIGRIDQAEVVIGRQPVVLAPVDRGQNLAINPALIMPPVLMRIGLIAEALVGGAIPLIGTRIEIIVIALPFRRAVARLIG
jgi:hypothetical protein